MVLSPAVVAGTVLAWSRTDGGSSTANAAGLAGEERAQNWLVWPRPSAGLAWLPLGHGDRSRVVPALAGVRM